MRSVARLRIGELLVSANILTQDQLEEALRAQGQTKRRLGEVLVTLGHVDETRLTQVLSQQLAVPWISLYHVDFSRELLNLVPRELAEKHYLVPIFVRRVKKQNTLYVAMDDPTNETALEAVSQYAGLPTRSMLASPSDIRNAIRIYYGGDPTPGADSSMPTVPSRKPAIPKATIPDASLARARAMATVDEVEAVESIPPAALESERPPPLPNTSSSEEAPHVAAPVPPPPALPTAGMEAVAAPPTTAAPSTERAPSHDALDDAPEIEVLPAPKRGPPVKMVALTLLDGTTIQLPARAKTKRPSQSGEVDPLTARDLVSALRAVSHGASAEEILGEDPKWEAMFSALLSLLLRKGLIADWEFIEEYRNV
jgi:type IV pilus assembly protein PilB